MPTDPSAHLLSLIAVGVILGCVVGLAFGLMLGGSRRSEPEVVVYPYVHEAESQPNRMVIVFLFIVITLAILSQCS